MTLGAVKSTLKECLYTAALPASSVPFMDSSYVPSLRLKPIHLPSEQLMTDSAVPFTSIHVQVTFSLAYQCRLMVPLLIAGLVTNVITGGVMSITSKDQNVLLITGSFAGPHSSKPCTTPLSKLM